MDIRKITEELEEQTLSPFATKSFNSLGREKKETECSIRTCFQRDRDRITHAKSFRRLSHKTQVYISPEGDHYRTRLTHTLEVTQIARTLAKALRLNEDLTEAISLGHDIGHTPFGHAGEECLNDLLQKGFTHNEQSVRVLSKIEKTSKDLNLNLTKEVLDGILNHQTSGSPSTLEGKIVRISDKIAYVNHDVEDAIRGGILHIEDIPIEYRETFVEKKTIDAFIKDIINNSYGKNEISMSKEYTAKLYGFRKFLFNNFYDVLQVEERKKTTHILTDLFEYYFNNYDKVPKSYSNLEELGDNKETIVADYIGSMTDRYAVKTYENIFVPKSWRN